MSISKEAIEAAARAIYDVRDDPYDDDEWEEMDSTDREECMCQARAALTAAAPYMEAALLRRIEVQAFIIAERDKELMQIQGPCRAPGCGLHRAHNGPCTIREGETK